MAASLLESQLNSLHQCLKENNLTKRQEEGILDDIRQLCVNEYVEKGIDLVCSVLFDKDKGLVCFLSKTVANEEFQVSKQKALEVLSEFVQKTGKKILPYALDIKDVCMSLFFRERLAKVKNAAIPVLIKVIELSAGSAVGKDFNLDKLVSKFFMELTKSVSKLSATVKEKIYMLLGIVSEVYPEYMADYSQKLVTLYIGALKAEMTCKTKKPELSVIAGCLEGLTSSLVNFTQSAEEGSKNSYEIFKYARMAIDPDVNYTRYDVPRAGLKLLSRHAAQFSIYLVEDYQGMYDKLRVWSKHQNRDMLNLGTSAVEAFLMQVSGTLVQRAKEGKKEGAIFKFFIQKFRNLMNEKSSTSKELSLAIRGYGLLATPCRTFLTSADVQFMFSEMMNKSEQQYLSPDADIEEKLYNLPSYLEALANIVKEVDYVSETYATSLERLMIVLVENLSTFHSSMHYLAFKSLLWILLSVMPKAGTFQQIASGFVYQSLIRTCSHPPVMETEQVEDEPEMDATGKKTSYRDYIDMWSTVLNSPSIKEFALHDISIEMRQKLTEALYDNLMNSILKILSKLDLTSQTASEIAHQEKSLTSVSNGNSVDDRNVTDPVQGLLPSKPKDFQIFINIVDFSRELLPKQHTKLFERWIFTVCHAVIVQSTDKPLVSGFYKLLAISMKIANKLEYFKDVCSFSRKMEIKMEVDGDHVTSNQHKVTCYMLMKKFAKEVLVRMKQFRDDLLASCLTFILSLPKEIIAEEMEDIVPAIQITLTIGLSYLPLAMVALDALEYWSQTFPQHVLAPYYCKILPHLDSYLRTADQGADEVSVDKTLNLTKSKTGKGRGKMFIRLVKSKKDENDQGYTSKLSQVKQRIILLLGGLGGSLNHNLLANADMDISKQAIAWDTQQHLKFDMPFIDMKPTIYFDSFLPHIVGLATTSTDRQTKVAACELLHSLTLYCIGRHATLPGKERYSLEPIYSKLFPSMLKLACDVDLVTKQLFEPLLMQLIHWFTNNKKAESEETMVLLDAIYEGIIQPMDTALRDFSAMCLKEFLQWSIKQTKNVEKSPVNAKSVLKRLYSYALHPGAFKRLGAAVAFNNIYTVFREDNTLVNLYTFQILVYFVESLAIAHKDEVSLGTQDQCKKALEHVERIIKVKKDILKVENKARTEPKHWSVVKLDIGVRWLLRQCGRPQTECRHTCMKLVHEFAPLIAGVKSTQNYFQIFYKKEKGKYFITRFEGNEKVSKEKSGIANCPVLTDIDQRFSFHSILSWFDMVLAPLDCYSWVFGQDLITSVDMFAGDGIKQTKIFKSIQYFVENIAMSDLSSVANLFDGRTKTEFFTPREIEEFNKVKCTVTVRVLYFLAVLLGKSKGNAFKMIPAEMWNTDLWRLICLCVIEPASVGFNIGDIEVMTNLPHEMEKLLKILSTAGILSAKVLGNMQKEFANCLQGERDLAVQIKRPLSDCNVDSVKLQQLVTGYDIMKRVGILGNVVSNAAALKENIMNHVLQGLTESVDGTLTAVSLSPTVLSSAKSLLNLAFHLGFPAKKLVETILSTCPVQSSTKGYSQCLGELFFSTFQTVVVAQLVDTAGDVMPLLADQAMKNGRRISSVVVSMVDHVSRDKELRKTMGSNLVSSILGQWKQFSGWWDSNTSIDLHSMALLLLTKMVLLDSKFVSNPAHPHFKDVFTMYQKMLTNNKTNLAFKTRVLDLLPFFAMLPEPHSKTLKGSLDRLVADNFPLKSWEFEAESPQYKDYTAAIDRILNGLELSGSLMLLELLISVFCREPTHQYEAPILESINRFTKRLSLDKQKAAVDVAYDIFTQLSFPAEVRVTTIDKVALPMLRVVQKTALIQFFCNHIGEMRTTLENKLVKGSDQENQLVAKSCTYKLLEVMYCRLEKDEVFSKSSAVNDRFCSVKGIKAESGKEMTQVIMKNAHEAKGEDVRGETSLLEQRRQYHCTAYNLLIAILSCTQTEAKFYAVFLFQENEAKGNFVFDNLVDKEKVYEFPSELKAPLARKKQYVSIRNEVKSERVSDSDENYEYSASIHLASQYLADSSLSEDFNQYDFSATSQLSGGSPRDKSSKLQVVRKSSYTDIDDDSDTKVTVEGDYVELEMDDLNQHECMAAMIALLKHMQRTKIIPLVESGIVPEMPLWMKHLHEKLKNSRTHTNVKYFIGKLIVNTPEIFRPYAKYWLKPLCLLILDSSFSSVNYYLIDVVVTMMSWHKVAIPEDSVEEKAMATRLTEFLTAHVYSETRAVYRNNLDLVKTLMTVWKSRIDVPYHIIYKQLKQSDVGKKEGSIGIHVLGLVLSCDLPPYGPVAPVDEEKYLAAVVQYCTHDYKTVYSAAAEVVGLILKYMAVKDKVTDGSFHSYVVQLLGSIQQAKPDNFVISVDRMHRHYAPIADRFMNKMLFLLPKLHGEFLSVCLKVILSRVETIENVFVELKSKGLMSFLTHREEETQLTSLKIVQAISAKLKPSELLSILSVIAVISISPSVACRNVMYDILMWVYDNYREEDNEEGHKIMQLTKENLLKGLGDEELQCRLLVQNFWSSETRLPSNTSDRLVAMLEAMYSPITEQQFLSYATNLVLEMTSKSPDYLREIFEHPLEECRFQDYSVKSSWRQRHAVMTPLFASTMASQTADMDISMADDTTDGQIRATIDAQQFSATQDASRAPFNWLTGSSLDTYTDYSTVGSEAPSSLLFTVGTADMAARLSMKPRLKPRFAPTRPKPGTSKEKPGENTKKKADDFESNEMSRLKRRFLRDQEKTRVFFAKQNYRIQKMRKVVQEEQKTRRENQVTMYRKYRKGDLPDIQIKYSYIIAPLQAVAHRDSTIAKLLFGAIFKAIFAKLDEVKTEREVQQTIQEISTSINTILSGSTQYFPPFISCILDILYELRTKLDVDISNVGTAAVVSNLQPLGICVLEEQLIHQNAGEARPAKRGRTEGMNVSEDVSSWIELSRLYKSVNEYDVLQGIFSNKIGTQEITKDAVTLEARGDYHGARKLYEKALSEEDWEDGKPLDIELDMWDDCRMECLDHLAQWKPLEEISTSAVENGNISRVWEDTFYQEHYLPYIIRSKVKLMLQGDEEQQSLLKFIDASMKMSEPKSFLESRYCEELAMMYIWQSDYDRARHYVSMAMEKFQQEWSSTDTLMLNSRTSQLQKLQPLVEMQEFLNFMSHESNFTTILPAKRLLNKWESKSLHPLLDPVSIWDDLVTNRNVFLDHICSHVSSVKTEDSMDIDSQSDDVYNEFLESKVRLKLQMVESCCYTNNNKLALTLLASTKDQCKETGSDVVNVDWSHLYTLTHQTKAMAPEASWSDELFTSILSTLDRLGKYDKKEVLKRESGLGRRHFSLSGNSFKLLALGVHSVTHLEDLNVKVKDKFTELTGVKKYKKDEMIDQLVQLGYSRIKCSLSYEDHSNKAYRYGMEEAYLSVAKYCDQFLHMQEDEEIKFSEKTVKEFPESIVTCLLNAVKLDSMEARQRFPRLLQLVELYPDIMALFIKKCDEVPSWMFIMWIGQMMALLDRPEAPAVHNIIIQLVKEYPQAVVYPYHLSSEGYKFGNSPKDKRNKEFVEKLSSMLGEEKLPLVCKFISALDNLSQPDQTFKDWADDMKIKLNKQKADKEELVTDFIDMYKKLLEQGAVRRPSPSQEDSLSDSPSIVEKGKYSRKFADRFKKDIESGFGKDGKKLIDMTYNSFSKVFSKIYNDMQEEIKGFGGGKRGDGPLLPPKSLKDYCQWLSEFNPNVQGRDLEIPGQYDGLSKPMPEYHTKIAGFDQRVLVMTSIRKPKRITIRGNDEREYNYLVKGGEDLRQDQRIEQLFYIMNQVFDKDPACKQRKLRLKTYQVVPLTTRVGLIEWMNNTMPLKDFLLSNFTEDELKHFRGKQGPAFLHHNWIMKLHKQQATAYHEMYRKCSRTEVKREFQQKEGKVPWDLCRRAFQKMSSSPEAFHVLRCKFAVTHALISTCQYILGIGDRHLSNFMINLNNGEMVGIDFGHAFGSATQFLPIPELMPLRLTRQIRNIMMPLQVKGLIESTMVHSLRALRNDCDLLLNTMDIFVKEPSVDWIVNAEKQIVETNVEEDLYEDGDISWYPKEKVAYVKRKLRGENPCYITRDELRLGHKKKSSYKSLESVLMGEKKEDRRAQLPQYNLSVEQQVEALIDQATDTNILGRVYAGWEPWM